MSSAKTAGKITGHEIHAKWSRIPEHEALRLKTMTGIVEQLQGRYTLSVKAATQQVEEWANGRTF